MYIQIPLPAGAHDLVMHTEGLGPAQIGRGVAVEVIVERIYQSEKVLQWDWSRILEEGFVVETLVFIRVISDFYKICLYLSDFRKCI